MYRTWGGKCEKKESENGGSEKEKESKRKMKIVKERNKQKGLK
jgi:hypothetical protein